MFVLREYNKLLRLQNMFSTTNKMSVLAPFYFKLLYMAIFTTG